MTSQVLRTLETKGLIRRQTDPPTPAPNDCVSPAAAPA
jgi:hypothetical protein